MDLQAIRREYLKGGLSRSELPDNPIDLFRRWLQEAIDMELADPTAMVLATVSRDGQPSQRIVLLKEVSAGGFVFYTNYESRKASAMASNSRVSLHFPWYPVERQVLVCGLVQKVSPEESRSYFASRPRESQFAAWASAQSKPLKSKDVLLRQFQAISSKFAEGEIPLPEFWGGYRVQPHSIEFWQGGKHRLHDRFEYTLHAGNQWQIERLSP
jgi:pyridoxamine 5'-phosphate oxidase